MMTMMVDGGAMQIELEQRCNWSWRRLV